MSATVYPPRELSPHQRALRDKCFHPAGRFVEFAKEELLRILAELESMSEEKARQLLAHRTM